MNFKRFLGKCRSAINVVGLNAQPSFSQVGEDIIINYLFNQLEIIHPTYLEVGTNLPVRGNNTYYFYNKGSRGVCIEPDPELYKIIVKKRPGDVVLNIGIGLSNIQSASLYVFPAGYEGWNTFSEKEAKIRESESGIKVKKAVKIELRNINDVISAHFNNCPNLISIDVEGLDFKILQSLDFNRFRPEVFCIETISFSTKNKEEKLTYIIDYLNTKGYFSYADTHVNTIFCRTDLFEREK